jgi:hypothetical protein
VYIYYIYIQDAAEVNAKRVDGLKSKGNAAFAQGDYQTALTQYSLACRLDPKKCLSLSFFQFSSQGPVLRVTSRLLPCNTVSRVCCWDLHFSVFCVSHILLFNLSVSCVGLGLDYHMPYVQF